MSVTTDAISHLHSLKLPTRVEQSLDYLIQLRESLILLSLYQVNFSEEWKNSTSPLFTSTPKSPHSPKELEFFQLVDERLFPIGLGDADLDERLNFIPFWPEDVDFYLRSIDEFDEGEQFLICLYDPCYLENSWLTHFSINPNKVVPIEQIDFNKLETLCREASQPLCYLYDAMSIIDRSTGSIWLDETCESCLYLEWSQNNIDILAQDWQKALNLRASYLEVAQWLQNNCNNKILTIELWNLAKKDESYPSFSCSSLPD
ncbi:MAG TPA: hypothetical protein DCY88_18090 [Cyanobacteria bacterium UBA11372]|nr:hypothetical protein [Cyanobacteria bacterium UBA11372]